MKANAFKTLSLSCATLALLGITFSAEAATTNWKAAPTNNQLANSANWTAGVPGSSDTGVFSTSTVLNPAFPTTSAFSVGEFHFSSTAPSYTFAFAPTSGDGAAFTQAGMTLDAGALAQTFNISGFSTFLFSGAASADASGLGLVTYNQSGASRLRFIDTSSAGSAIISTSNDFPIRFRNSSTAAGATITLNAQGQLEFSDSASAANAQINVTGNGALAQFFSANSGGNCTLVLGSGGIVSFYTNNSIGSISGGGTLVLNGQNNTLSTGTNNTNTTFSGKISGFGNITKVGAGNFTIQPPSGFATEYTGTISANAGTIALAAAPTTLPTVGFAANGTGILRIDGNNSIGSLASDASGTINFQNFTITTGLSGASTTLAGPLVGPGNLTKVGSGTLNITSNNPTFTGTISVNAGKLALNGTLGNAFIVAPGATLSGTGSAKGTVTNSGTVAPGNSVGTLSVGSYEANSGSTTQIEVGQTLASQIVATSALGAGTVTINDGAKLAFTFDNGIVYQQGTLYEIIAAENGFTSPTHFSSVSGMLPGHTLEVIYNPNQVQLLIGEFDFAEKAPGGDAGTVADILDLLNPAYGSDLSNVLGVLQQLTGSAYDSALDQMQPSALNALAIAQENNSTRVTQVVTNRMLQLYDAVCLRGCEPEKHFTFWGDLLGDFQRQDAIENQVGFNANTGGLITGVDYGCMDHFFVGASTAYTYTALDWKASRGDATISSLYADIYAAWFSKYVYANASLLGGYNWYGVDRKIKFMSRTAKSDHTGVEYDAHGEAGLLFSIKKLDIRPFDSLDYIYLHERGFTERGAKSLDLEVKSKVSNMLRNELGIGFASCFGIKTWKLVPDLKFSWIREVRFKGAALRTEFKGTDMPFEVFGMKPNRSLFGAGAGLTGLFLEERLAATLRYAGEFQGQYSDQNINLQIGYKF